MAQEITVFTNAQFGSIRAFKDEQGEPLFIAKDVCGVLELGNVTWAMKRLEKDEFSSTKVTQVDGIKRNMFVVNEYGLYNLILGSRKPEAKEFKRWVTHEVLPAIRKDGAYVYSDGTEDDNILMARGLLAAQRQIEAKNQLIAKQQAELDELYPKALFADAVSASDGTCLVGELAKILTQAGFKIGQNRLFALLREDGYLGKSGSNKNVPLQRYIEQGLFKIKETVIAHADGHTTINRTPKVTGKGQTYFLAKYAHVKELPTEDIDS